MILGIDEAGRGPWAGPLVVGAVVLPDEFDLPFLTDSKKLTAVRRQTLEPLILQQALGYGLGWVHADELDELGMSEALRLATRRAVEQVQTAYHQIVIDGTVNFLSGTPLAKYVTTMPKADATVPAVSAASILAKVARDRFMASQDEVYPGYGFSSHAGYGTSRHRQAIDALGVTPLHRLSFAPLAKYRQEEQLRPRPASGAEAERVVASALEEAGHEVVARNWRTRVCELDIISKNANEWWVTEVKHRKDNTGLAALTPRQRGKLALGAQLYAARHGLQDSVWRLQIATTSGDPSKLTELRELE